ncbi:MAG TPA: hypothetical protein PKY01_04510 [Candidatus Hydrogenedentes bacterium]|nr:hypothetical protein [Candidatus Hydrogenedentota bacterium]
MDVSLDRIVVGKNSEAWLREGFSWRASKPGINPGIPLLEFRRCGSDAAENGRSPKNRTNHDIALMAEPHRSISAFA